jgi:hypothetical protein
MNYYNLPKKDLLVLINKKLDVMIDLLKTEKPDNRKSEFINEISGDVEVLEPRNVFVRPSKSIGGCNDDCPCKNRKGRPDPLPYA